MYLMNKIISSLLINCWLISVNSLDICRKYCLNQRLCSDQYYDCLSYYENQRFAKNIRYFSGNQGNLLCGKQYFKPKVTSYTYLNMRIVGGQEANKAEFPWMVSLQKEAKGKFIHYCGGAVISDYFILTAAHCADIFVGSEDKLRIKFGSNNIDNINDGVYMRVSKIIVHELWDRDVNINDIALYKTERPIRYAIDEQSGRYLVNCVCLPRKEDAEPDFALVAGWGQMSGQSNEITPKLQKALVPKFSFDSCQINYQQLGIVTRDMFCYGGVGEVDSCLGDSGGPLVDNQDGQYFIIGVVSYGVPCALKNYPTIYTKIAEYLDWIYQVTKL